MKWEQLSVFEVMVTRGSLGERQIARQTRAEGYFEIFWHYYIIIIITKYHVVSVD